MRKLLYTTLLASACLTSQSASAWFQICNTKANGAEMYVTYAYYQPNTTRIHTDVCGSYYGVYSPRYYTAWKHTGWWRLQRNQCATVYGPALTNTWGYVYAWLSDGSSLTNANVPFKVSNYAFGLDQYVAGPYGSCGGPCIGTSASGLCSVTPSYWTVNTLPVYQGTNQNYRLNIN